MDTVFNNNKENTFYETLFDKAIIIYAAIVILINLFIKINFGDDVTYFQYVLNDTDIISYIIYRYVDGPNTRVIVDSLVAIIARFPYIFKVINIFVLIKIAMYIKELIPEIKEKKFIFYISLLFVIFYPFMNMSEAGWIATEVNYSWPLCAFLYVLTGLKKYYNGKKIYFYNYILYTICFLFFTNSEQLCCISLGILTLILALSIKEKKKILFPAVFLALNIGSLLFIITAPGFQKRINLESLFWPDYPMYSFIDKIYMGFTETINILIRNYNFVFLGFCGFTALFLFKNTKNILLRIISLVPIISVFCFTYLKPVIIQPFPMLNEVFSFAVRINASNAAQYLVYIPVLVYITIICCLLISLNYVFNDLKDFIINIVVVGLGFSSKFIISFSPALYKSGGRAAIFLYASLIFSVIYMFVRYSDILNFKEKKVIITGLSVLAFFTFINTLISITVKS